MFRKLMLLLWVVLFLAGCSQWAIQTVEVSPGVFISVPVTLAPTSDYPSPTPDGASSTPVPTTIPSSCGS